jgi:hypothetical protein
MNDLSRIVDAFCKLAASAFYHGTSEKNAESIERDGFDLEALRRSDPGDLGWGIYLTNSIHRARAYGSAVLEVVVQAGNFAKLPNPYFLKGMEELKPETDVEKLFYENAFDSDGNMLTIHGDRVAAAKNISRAFILNGYDGIIGEVGPGQIEVVVFQPKAIEAIRRVE